MWMQLGCLPDLRLVLVWYVRIRMDLLKGLVHLFFDMDFYSPIAELWTILDRVCLAHSLGCERLLVELDNIQAINLINKRSQTWSEVGLLVEAIWMICPSFIDIEFLYISRRCNVVADCIAKRARELRLFES